MIENKSKFDIAVETFKNSSLTESESEVYVLRELQGLSRRSAADRLDKNPNTIDTHHQKAKNNVSLPHIDTVKRVSARDSEWGDGDSYEIWFENGAMLCYMWDEERETVVEKVVFAGDLERIHKSVEVGGFRDRLKGFVLNSVCEYTQVYRDNVEMCRSEWPNLFEAITLHEAKTKIF